MNALDVWFLHVEDAADHMHIGSVGVFEGPAPAFDDLLRLVASKLEFVPRYRQRVRPVAFGLVRPTWVDDPHFRLEYHVRHTALPPPGGDEELRNLVSRVMSQQLDRRRPLWETWMIEGLEGGRWAVLSKVHHSVVDGVAGMDLLALVLGSPDAEIPEPSPWTPEPEPRTLRLLARAGRRTVGSIGPLVRGAGGALRDPATTARLTLAGVRGFAELVGLLRPAPDTSLNGPIGPHRAWTWTTCELATIKAVKHQLGGTVNDVVLAAVTRGFRDLLRERGEDLDEIRSMVPVSLRRPGDEGVLDNRVASFFAHLPVGEPDPAERFRRVRDEMIRLKRSGEDVATEALVSGSALLPPVAVSLFLRGAVVYLQHLGQHRVNTVTTNVPGPPFPLYLLGRRMVEAMPYVPIAEAVRVGVAILSYSGRVSFGVTGDYDTAADIDVLREGIETGIAELAEITGVSTSSRKRSSARPA